MKRNLQEFIGITLAIILMFIVVGSFSAKDDNIDTPTASSNEDDIGSFKIYSRDINTDENIIVDEFGFLSSQDTIEERLQAVADSLSENEFNGLNIELVEIQEIEGKKIAVLNLKENEENLDKEMWSDYTGVSWAKDYFQGSAGGEWTCYTLQTTMLQPDYDGQWVDGVKFLYDGGENNDFQHVEGIDRIKYR